MKKKQVPYKNNKKFFYGMSISLALLFIVGLEATSSAIKLQNSFDPMPSKLAEVYRFVSRSNRAVNYSIFGPKDGFPVLFIDGNPSNAKGADILSPWRSTIGDLNLRFVHPERIGFGDTPFTCNAPYTNCITAEQYADDWAELMQSLGYKKYAVLAASQGGQYADVFMEKYWPNVRSLHLSSAIDTSGTRGFCPLSDPLAFKPLLDSIYQDPMLMWSIFPRIDFNVLSSIPGMVDWFNGNVTLNTDGSGGSYDVWLECNTKIGSLSQVKTPVFIYHGLLDDRVPISIAENHAREYPNVVRFLVDMKRAHLASLRNLTQTLWDIRYPHDPKRVICLRLNDPSIRETIAAPEKLANFLLTNEVATPDTCAWVGTPSE